MAGVVLFVVVKHPVTLTVADVTRSSMTSFKGRVLVFSLDIGVLVEEGKMVVVEALRKSQSVEFVMISLTTPVLLVSSF